MLIEMEIDTGNRPPVASKPYTLPLKHYKWVQLEIENARKSRYHRKKHFTLGFSSGDSSKEKAHQVNLPGDACVWTTGD